MSFLGRFKMHDTRCIRRIADNDPRVTPEDDDVERESGRFDLARYQSEMAGSRAHMAGAGGAMGASMERFKEASDRRHGIGDARAAAKTADEATVKDPKASSMQRFQAASRLKWGLY